MRPLKRFVPASLFEGTEAPGQVGGSGNLGEDIALCPLQTIDAVFDRLLPRDGKILEAGAGRGRWVFHLRRRGLDAVGIELASTEVANAKRSDPDIPIIVGNVLRMPFPDNSFAAVISLGVLEHFEDGPQEAFREIQRVLVPGGLLFVTVPIRNLFRFLVSDPMKAVQTVGRRLRRENLVFEEYRYTRGQFTKILEDAGFSILETAPDDFFPPKNMGLYTDSRLFRAPNAQWELNGLGRCIRMLCNSISPWVACSGGLWVCRTKEDR
jgi:SAM-dependent methyltransferase